MTGWSQCGQGPPRPTRCWRTLPDALTVAQAQASSDAFCARVGDSRVRRRDGVATTVGEFAALEPLTALPPAFPATVRVSRTVTAQALVSFRGNSYSVPPGLAGTTVIVTHHLTSTTLDISTGARGTTNGVGPAGSALPTVLARHHREPDGAGVLVRDSTHVTALQTAVLSAFSTDRACSRKTRRPPSPAALAHAEHLHGSTSGPRGNPDQDRDVVVDLAVWAAAAEHATRRVAP